jgi:hypothetical protein
MIKAPFFIPYTVALLPLHIFHGEVFNEKQTVYLSICLNETLSVTLP